MMPSTHVGPSVTERSNFGSNGVLNQHCMGSREQRRSAMKSEFEYFALNVICMPDS